jgi:hypothetical protein
MGKYSDIIEMPEVAKRPDVVPAPAFPKVVADPNAKKSIFLGLPCYACMLNNTFMASLIALQALCAQNGVQVYMDFVGNESLIPRARNILVQRFLQTNGFTHFMFIDSDIGFNPESVLRLLKFDKHITSAVYAKKSIDWALIKRKVAAGLPEDIRQMGIDFNLNIQTADPPVEGFVKVLDVATGFLLMSRDVLEKMVWYFGDSPPEGVKSLMCKNDIQGQNVDRYCALFDCLIDPSPPFRYLSEDYAFCRRYQQMIADPRSGCDPNDGIWASLAEPLAHVGSSIASGNIVERYKMEH